MAFRELIDHLQLDALLIDTHPGLNEETLFALAISTTLAIILRPDQQDYEGTGVAVEVARSLEVPRLVLVVNKNPPDFDEQALAERVAQTYQLPGGGGPAPQRRNDEAGERWDFRPALPRPSADGPAAASWPRNWWPPDRRSHPGDSGT